MGKYEERAKELKANGNNCSVSLYTAFKEGIELDGNIPAPRSLDGKCGALLTAIKILKETGNQEKVEEFEKRFIEKFGYNKCADLIKNGRRCSEYVGEAAKMLEEIIK